PHQPNDKPRDVVLGHEVPYIRRQKQRLIDLPGAKVLAHSPSLNQTRWDLNSDYSDRLLGGPRYHLNRLILAVNFPSCTSSRTALRSSVLRMICGSRLLMNTL